MKTKLKIVLLIVIVSFFNSCKRCKDPANPSCENYDPCYGKTSTSAYFVIEEKMQYTNKWIECDSVNGVGNISIVRFRALHDADSFIWTLGAETVYEKSFMRNDFPPRTYIPVTLVVINKHPDTKCHPNDDGRDTFRRMMYTWGDEIVWNQDKKGYEIVNPKPIQGVYTGHYESNPGKLVTIVMRDTIYSCSILQHYSTYGLNGINLPEGFSQPIFDDINCGYFGVGWIKHPIAARLYQRAYRTNNYGDFQSDSIIQIDGFMQLSRDLKNVEIEFQYYPLWDEIKKKTLVKDKFIGRKIK
ncbi:MAG TPA: hypothetical protein VGF79_03410 [Bacteroidia bacterium]